MVKSSSHCLNSLWYGKVIKKISEIREFSKGSMKKIDEEMILPRIIVIGNESSGKSSTLERITGQGVIQVRWRRRFSSMVLKATT